MYSIEDFMYVVRDFMYTARDFVGESILSAFVASALTALGALYLGYSKRKRNAQYLASRITHQLDEYVLRCVHVARDYGPNEFDDGIVPDKSPPSPPVYPSDVDWISIDRKLMHRILALPSKAEYAKILVYAMFSESYPPDYEEGIEEQQLQYSKLGIEAYEITKKLRSAYKIPHRSIGNFYDKPSEAILREKIDKIEKKRGKLSKEAQA